MEIRLIKEEELRDALELAWTVFAEYEAHEYSREGVRTFREFMEYDRIHKKFISGEMCFYGCFFGKDMVGMLASRNADHISMFFVKKEYQKHHIGRKLFQAYSDACSKENTYNTITVNSSSYAVEFYRKLGFTEIGPEQTADGIRFTPMQYRLLVKVLDGEVKGRYWKHF